MAGGDGCANGWSVNKGGRGCGRGRSASPTMRTKYRQRLGKHRVVWFWSQGLLVAWWATNAKQVSTAFGENVWLLGLFVAGGLPALSFYSPSFGWCVRGSGCLACWLLGFGENTYSDGWIMDRGKNVTFWCVGCLVCLP